MTFISNSVALTLCCLQRLVLIAWTDMHSQASQWRLFPPVSQGKLVKVFLSQ